MKQYFQWTATNQHLFVVRDVPAALAVLDHPGNESEEHQVHNDAETERSEEEDVEGDRLGFDETHGSSHVLVIHDRNSAVSRPHGVGFREDEVTDQREG